MQVNIFPYYGCIMETKRKLYSLIDRIISENPYVNWSYKKIISITTLNGKGNVAYTISMANSKSKKHF
jgi:hypothetical protein